MSLHLFAQETIDLQIPKSDHRTQNPKLSPAPPAWVSERVRRARRAGKKALNFRMKLRPAGDGSQSISVAAGGFAAKPAQGCNWLKRSKLVRGEALVGRPVLGLRRRQFRSSIVRCLPGMSKIRHTRNEGPQGLGGQSAGGRFRLPCQQPTPARRVKAPRGKATGPR